MEAEPHYPWHSTEKKQRNVVETKMDFGQLRSELSQPFEAGKSAAERCQLDFCGAVELEKE